jgi:hypothetical protein
VQLVDPFELLGIDDLAPAGVVVPKAPALGAAAAQTPFASHSEVLARERAR